jgi:toxin YoeB
MAKKKQPEEQPVPIQIIRLSPIFTSKFKIDLGWWFKTDVKKADKVLDLVTAVMAEPFVGLGKPEPLKYLEANIWSRRVDLEHRLVYLVGNEEISFLSCRYHYE